MKRIHWMLASPVLLFLFAVPAYAEEPAPEQIRAKVTVTAEESSGWREEEGGLFYYEDNEKQLGWLFLDDGTYYLGNDGKAVKNRWVADQGDWYFFGEDYRMARERIVPDSAAPCYLGADGKAVKNRWVFHEGKWFFFKSDCHALAEEWKRDSKGWCYLQKDGTAAADRWISWKGSWFFLKNDCRMAENEWANDSGGPCYLKADGRAAKNSWISWEDNWYYVKNDFHRAENEWIKDSVTWCFLLEDGKAARDRWVFWGGDWYYLKSNCRMAASEWANDSSGRCYLDASGRYRMVPRGYNTDSVQPGGKTLKNFLQNALIPCGSTLYVFGGGWGSADAQKIGYLETWGTFFVDQGKSSYNSNNWRFRHGKGLDCSGFVAWAAYNTIYTENGKDGILEDSGGATGLATRFSQRGWTKVMDAPKKYEDLRPGDVCSMYGHVYICLGICKDGSAVILHSSTAGAKGGGVQLSGTQDRNNQWNSEAIQLAKRYMKEYFPQWPWEATSVGSNYLTSLVNIGRWKNDPDGLQNMSAEEILEIIFRA